MQPPAWWTEMRHNGPGMRTITLPLLFLAISVSLPAQTAWKLVWSDEFNGAANTPPDPTIWNYDLGGGGWGNGEQETYTNSVNNAFEDGAGHLVIRAIRDSSGNYTSARIRSGMVSASDAANVTFQYGKIEARIKLPYGKGVWPAFWMLGSNFESVNWPQCGEVDILENFGQNFESASIIHGSLHGPNFTGSLIGAPYTLPNEEKFTDDFHNFSIEWSENAINYFVDGALYESLNPSSLPSGGQWVFNAPFFVILNLAIGGPTTFLGAPDANTPFPQDMLVDYVRVYQSTSVAANQPAIAPGGVLNAASSFGTMAPGSLSSLYGTNLADGGDYAVFTDGAFASTSNGGVTVSVNGWNAPLVYVSPTQINFQFPWEAALAPANANVTVTHGGVTSFAEPVTLTPAAPSVFENYTDGTALAVVYGGGPIAPGATVTLYGNGFGVKNATQADGVPANPASLTDIETTGSCTLTIAGMTAQVQYCGAAPYLVIDQLNFVYPADVPASSTPAIATLTIAGVTGTFLIASPAQ